MDKKINETLIKELGINNLPEDKQAQIITKMTEVLLKKIFVETMDKLGEQGVEEYEKMLEKNASPEEMEEFFKSKIRRFMTP